MSNSNLLQGYTWDAHDEYDDDPQQQFSRPIQDEVISVYEVYVKEETVGADGRSDISIASNEASSSSQLMQGECLDLDAAMGSEMMNVDGTITKLLQSKDASKHKILEQNVSDENAVVGYNSNPVNEGPNSAATRLVDKDDPRSRLHFVKYLKRDGKTLKIWECGICSKEFRHQYTLMRHLPTHTDERNFKCEACGKAFRQLSTLSQHRAIHSDARPYVCEFCKKTFNRVSTLISHRKTHSEHKPHKCHMCGKGFHQKGNLRNHVFTHTNERPYKCETCGKGFNQMSNLMCHKIKTHAHAEKMQYVCGICGKEFPRRFSLRSHEEYKHGIKYRNPNAPVVLQDINEPNPVKNENVSIVQSIPNGVERPTIGEVGDKENLNPGAGFTQMGSVIVDKIETKAMENAILEGQTPFALFKPVKGIPVLVKVASAAANRKQLYLDHALKILRMMKNRKPGFDFVLKVFKASIFHGTPDMLTPATAEDLRMAGKMSLSPTLADIDGVKAVQIKVPVVATVTQRVEPDGTYSFLIEPPGPGQEQESLIEPIESQFCSLDQRGIDLRSNFERNSQSGQVNSESAEDCSDLLELAAQGGIQFVRATEDGRYEVMTNSEARDLMAQNSHDVTILDGEEAEAISVVNLRGQQQQDNQITNSQSEEIILGDSNNQITILNSGNNSMMHKSNLEIDGIEILGDKDIRILQAGKNLDNDFDRFGHNGITIFDQEKMEDYCIGGKEFSVDSPSSNEHINLSNHQNFSTVLSQNSSNKNMQQHSINSFISKNQPAGIPILNHSYPSLKHNHSFSDSISTMFSSNDHTIIKSQQIELPSKFKFNDFNSSENLNVDINQQPEVKILGSKSNNKVKILGHSMDKAEIEKVLQLGNHQASAAENVKILGSKTTQRFQGGDYKDLKILNSYDQFNSIPQRKEQVKILGKKKEQAQANFSNDFRNSPAVAAATASSFEVETSNFEMGRSCGVPEMIVIEDSPQREISYKSADFIQASYKSGNQIEIDMLENSNRIRDLEMHVNSLNSDYQLSASSEDADDKIKEVTTISEKDFEMIGHCEAIRYNSLPDLD